MKDWTFLFYRIVRLFPDLTDTHLHSKNHIYLYVYCVEIATDLSLYSENGYQVNSYNNVYNMRQWKRVYTSKYTNLLYTYPWNTVIKWDIFTSWTICYLEVSISAYIYLEVLNIFSWRHDIWHSGWSAILSRVELVRRGVSEWVSWV